MSALSYENDFFNHVLIKLRPLFEDHYPMSRFEEKTELNWEMGYFHDMPVDLKWTGYSQHGGKSWWEIMVRDLIRMSWVQFPPWSEFCSVLVWAHFH